MDSSSPGPAAGWPHPEVTKRALRFVYEDAEGNQTIRTVTSWRDEGDRIVGWCHDRRAERSFLKRRVLEWIEGGEAFGKVARKASTGGARRRQTMNTPTPLAANASQFCFACGSAIDHRAELCPKCGVRQKSVPAAGKKSRGVAVLLALFLGGLGIHKFYLGRPVWGILYILFCWTFIPSILALIEAIVYLCTSEQAFAAKYG